MPPGIVVEAQNANNISRYCLAGSRLETDRASLGAHQAASYGLGAGRLY